MKSIYDLVEGLRAQYSEEPSDHLSDLIQQQLAIAIAHTLAVPAEPNGTGWETHRLTVRKLLDDINEQYLIDISVVTELIRNIWTDLYNLVHFPQRAINVAIATAIAHVKKNGENELQVIDAINLSNFVSTCSIIAELVNGQQGA